MWHTQVLSAASELTTLWSGLSNTTCCDGCAGQTPDADRTTTAAIGRGGDGVARSMVEYVGGGSP